MPYVVFIAAPELETLRAMHKAVVDAGITTKRLTVGALSMLLPFIFPFLFRVLYSHLIIFKKSQIKTHAV